MDKLKVIFLGGKQAGVLGLLTIIAAGYDVLVVVPANGIVRDLAERLLLPCYDSVRQKEVIDLLPETDLMISVHSREIIPTDILNRVRLGGINVHPCLSEYKGTHPIERFVKDGKTRASVGVHRMIAEVDFGEVLSEVFMDVDKNVADTVAGVYNALYPLYCFVLFDVLEELQNE